MGLELVTARSPLWWTQWEMLEQIRQSEICAWIRCKEWQTNLPTQLFSLSACIPCYFSKESCLAIGITRLFGDTNRQLVRGLPEELLRGHFMEALQSKDAHTHPETHRSWLPATQLPPLQPWLLSELLHWNAEGSLPSWWELNSVRKACHYQQTFKAPSQLERWCLKWCC